MNQDIRRRVAHLFVPPSTYELALQELEKKYGSPEVIKQAHVQHLAAMQPVKSGDFQALFEMAAMVRDAVTSTLSFRSQQEITHSTVVLQLATKLPLDLQREWGRVAYSLRPKIATLADFDKWIDGVVGAEESRGVNIFSQNNNKPAISSRQNQYSGPTMFNTNIDENHKDKENVCLVCSANPGHRLEACLKFRSKTPTERARVCAKFRHCFRCLGRDHFSRSCKKETTCLTEECGKRHHTLLHGAEMVAKRSPGEQGTNRFNIFVGSCLWSASKSVLLSIVPIVVKSNGKECFTFALLDPGSEATILTDRLAAKLGLQGRTLKVKFGTFCRSEEIKATLVSFVIESLDSSIEFQVEKAYTVPDIKLSRRNIDWPNIKKRWTHLEDLELPTTNSSLVENLIGRDVDTAHVQLDSRTPVEENQGPRAVLTPFGWIVTGKVPSSILQGPSPRRSVHFGNAQEVDAALVDAVQQFWSTASFGTNTNAKKVMSEDDARAIKILESSIVDVGQRYQVGLLLKTPNIQLPNNRPQALKRLFSVEQRLQRNSGHAEKYKEIIDSYLSAGYAKEVPYREINNPVRKVWYLPHHFVVNPHKPDKLRVVFNGSARYKGICLNDVLLRGPILLSNLVGVLLRFRQRPVAILADIASMYHQVQVNPADQSLLRFVWRQPGSQQPPTTFQMTVQVFGPVSSPTSCFFALRHTVETNRNMFPDVSDKLKDNFYADNLLDSFDNEEQAIKFARNAIKSLAMGGFRLNQWISSSKNLMSAIPASEWSNPSLNLDFDDLPVERTLGVNWNCQLDTLQITTRKLNQVNTKREMLSAMSSIFDPLGILQPVTTTVKILFQDTWRIKSGKENIIGWDERLPAAARERWEKWANELPLLNSLRIPRCLFKKSSHDPNAVYQLHIFSDASTSAYGAIAHLRSTHGNNIEIAFLLSKARIAPLKLLTVPRLELQAAVLAVRLATTIKSEMRINIGTKTFWIDSEIVLRWINSVHCRYSDFVSHRISELLDKTSPSQWRFVPGEQNPADLCTRGILPKAFDHRHQWISGPPFFVADRRKMANKYSAKR